jgi:predicted Zn finger-like uncharacterized protein
MYSQCPECHTRFRVTAEVLRVARGTVRCGRCGNAFDALARLSDTVPPARVEADELPANVGGTALAALPDAVVAAEYHFTADDLEKVFIDAQDWQRQFGPEAEGVAVGGGAGGPADAAADGHSVLVDESEPLEDITLEGERISIEALPGLGGDDLAAAAADERGVRDLRDLRGDREVDDVRIVDDDQYDLDSTDEFEVLDVPDAASPQDDDTGTLAYPGPARDAGNAPILDYLLEPDPQPEPQAPSLPLPEPQPVTVAPAPQRWRRLEEAAAEVPITAHREEAVERERSGWRTFAWGIACLLLAIGMVAQVTHHYRHDLMRKPTLGSVLREVYGRLGLSLSTNWDLAAYELRQWGNGTDDPDDDRISIRASLTNRALFAQPHPILRLELEDRFGEPIAVRDFEPADYLKNPTEASQLLGPSASTEAEILILNPGPDAVGYRLDACMRESPGQLRCALDTDPG